MAFLLASFAIIYCIFYIHIPVFKLLANYCSNALHLQNKNIQFTILNFMLGRDDIRCNYLGQVDMLCYA